MASHELTKMILTQALTPSNLPKGFNSNMKLHQPLSCHLSFSDPLKTWQKQNRQRENPICLAFPFSAVPGITIIDTRSI